MLWRILVTKFGSIRFVTVLLQPFKVAPFTAKYFNKISFFSSNSNSLFSSHTLAWLHKHSLIYMVCLFLSYLSHAFVFFDEILCYCLPYVFTTSKTIYKLKLLHKYTTEHTLHSRVKSSITQHQVCCFS